MLAISVANRWPGEVVQVTNGAVNGEVALRLDTGDHVVAIVTNASIDRLALAPGRRVIALVKAGTVLLSLGEPRPLISARNLLCGRVKMVKGGTVNGEVVVQAPSGLLITSVVTQHSIGVLGMAAGVAACAVFDASNVLLALPDEA